MHHTCALWVRSYIVCLVQSERVFCFARLSLIYINIILCTERTIRHTSIHYTDIMKTHYDKLRTMGLEDLDSYLIYVCSLPDEQNIVFISLTVQLGSCQRTILIHYLSRVRTSGYGFLNIYTMLCALHP